MMTNWEKYFSTPEKTAAILSGLQDIITHAPLYYQNGKYFRDFANMEIGEFKEYFATDLGTALRYLVEAPLDGYDMDEKTTLEWLQKE